MSRAAYPPSYALDPTNTWSGIEGNNEFVSGLMSGSKWGNVDPDSDVKISLSYQLLNFNDESILTEYVNYNDQTVWDYATYRSWDSAHEEAIDNSFSYYSSVANIAGKRYNKKKEFKGRRAYAANDAVRCYRCVHNSVDIHNQLAVYGNWDYRTRRKQMRVPICFQIIYRL